jgi:cytochrome c-type biogenesis protein CcmH/NrfG
MYARQLLRMDHKHVGALFLLGHIVYEMGNIQQACDYLAAAVTLSPENLDIKESYDCFKERLDENL